LLPSQIRSGGGKVADDCDLRSYGEQVKLFGEQWLTVAGILRLPFSHHVHHSNVAQHETSVFYGHFMPNMVGLYVHLF
jgi:hypothetical protein